MARPMAGIPVIGLLALCVCVPATAEDGRADAGDPAPTTHVHRIEVQDFGSGVLRVGDMSGDGMPDLLLAQAEPQLRKISCLTALTTSGRVLWQSGKPDRDNAYMFGDLPVQVHDWDDDGRNEVLYVIPATYAGNISRSIYTRERAERYEGDATMVVLDGRTGREKKRFPIPAPADDCFLFADLTGRGRRQDFVVKDRYWNMWGVSFEGKVLWHWKGSTGHYPAIADLDEDGRDEVFVGYTLLDHDGKVMFDRHPANGTQNPHSDANWIARLPDGSWRLVFGNTGAHMLDVTGRELWKVDLPEAQHVVAGRFRKSSPLQFALIERGMKRTATDVASLHLVDLDGTRVLSKKFSPGSWAVACKEIDWAGTGQPGEILVYGFHSLKAYAAIYDGRGNVVETFAIPWETPPAKVSGKEIAYATRADVRGDRRQEVIFFGPGGLCIYANARPLALPTHYNETIYSGV